jgi:hypothetical protein
VSDEAGPEQPFLRVVRGNPTAEELAALVAVLRSRPAGGGSGVSARASAWADPARALRRPLRPSPSARR